MLLYKFVDLKISRLSNCHIVNRIIFELGLIETETRFLH